MSIGGSVINSSIAQKAVNIGKKGMVLAKKHPKMALATGVTAAYMLGRSSGSDDKKGSLGKTLLKGALLIGGFFAAKRYCRNALDKFMTNSEVGKMYTKLKDVLKGVTGKLTKLPVK